jgi:hypothetical protein
MSNTYAIYNVPEMHEPALKKQKCSRRITSTILPFIEELKNGEYFDVNDNDGTTHCGYYVPAAQLIDGSKPFIIQLQMVICNKCGNYIDRYLCDNMRCHTSKHLYCSC